MLVESLRLFGRHILAYLGLSRLISSHRILFILSAEHYSFYQPNTPSLQKTTRRVSISIVKSVTFRLAATCAPAARGNLAWTAL
jgi:hypothetical protein